MTRPEIREHRAKIVMALARMKLIEWSRNIPMMVAVKLARKAMMLIFAPYLPAQASKLILANNVMGQI